MIRNQDIALAQNAKPDEPTDEGQTDLTGGIPDFGALTLPFALEFPLSVTKIALPLPESVLPKPKIPLSVTKIALPVPASILPEPKSPLSVTKSVLFEPKSPLSVTKIALPVPTSDLSERMSALSVAKLLLRVTKPLPSTKRSRGEKGEGFDVPWMSFTVHRPRVSAWASAQRG